jgi:hypothetical protein
MEAPLHFILADAQCLKTLVMGQSKWLLWKEKENKEIHKLWVHTPN